MIALVAVSAAVYASDKPYSYQIPPDMDVQPGIRVIVPFGRGNKRCEGIVLGLQSGHGEGLKPIERVMDLDPVLSAEFLRMAAFLRERYFCTYYDAVKAMLPAGLWFDSAESFERTERPLPQALQQSCPMAVRIVEAIADRGGSIESRELKQCFPDALDELEKTLQLLLKKKLLRSNLDFSRKVHDKTEKIATLAIPAEEAMALAERKRRAAPLQAEVLKLLCAVGSGNTKEICYLTGASMQTLNRLEKLGWVTMSVRDVFRTALPSQVKPAGPLQLNDEQALAFEALMAQSRTPRPGVSLLYGVTGSGKTSVYLSLIRKMLDCGRDAILLVPEISLTPQLISLLVSHFGETVAVLHSALRVSERYDAWKRIRQGHAHVVIGTRSAVFAPVQKLGIIIVDEEQEHSYKSENAPRYHAREVAIYRGSKEQALVVLGSATPSVETMYQARTGVYTMHRLKTRYNGQNLPQVEILDMKQEIRQGNNLSLSRPLQQALADNIQNGQQSILFLNRRGAGRCMICVDCGEVPQCPRCSVSLTYHTANHRLMCHYCGYSQPVYDHCPQCGGAMKVLGSGTQKVEQELHQLFPDAGILRMDADTVTASNSHEAILRRFQEEKIPILIGTQMVTKGLNFENVTLVGVIDADMSLYMNHFRAAETTFSLLTQVIGRSGRGTLTGRAMIQTMTPEHTVISLAARQDYDTFYALEITMRELHQCPPFGDLYTVMFTGPFETQTLTSAHWFRQLLEQSSHAPEYSDLNFLLLGPSPAAITKVNNLYRYCLTLHCANSRKLRLLLSHLLKCFYREKGNRGVTAFLDLNSYE